MSTFLTFLWTAAEVTSASIFGSAWMQNRRPPSQAVAATIALWLFAFTLLLVDMRNALRHITTIAAITIVYFYLLDGKRIHCFLVAILFYTLMSTLDTIVLYGIPALFGISISQFVEKRTAYILAVTMEKTAVLSACIWFYKKRNHEIISISSLKNFAITLAFPLTSAFLNFIIFYTFQEASELKWVGLYVGLILVLANIMNIYTVEVLSALGKKGQDLELLKQQMKLQTASYAALESSYREQRKAVHEFQKHIQALADLLQNSNEAIAKEYISRLQVTRSLRTANVHTGHPVVDVILNQKYIEAQEHNIQMQIHVNDLQPVKIPADALVVLLSNLLDNALEACSKVSGYREIICKMVCEDDVFLSVSNSSLPVEIVDGEIKTSKEGTMEHGYGIPAIRFVLEGLGAEFTFYYAENKFRFAAEIPNEDATIDFAKK